MHSAFPRGVTRTTAKKHSQTRPLLLGGKNYLQKAFFQKSATSQPHLSQEMMDFAYGSYSPLHLVCSKAEFSLPPQAAALSTPRAALVHQEEANHSWLTLYISQHQLSTITHCFQACQGFQSCRLQHTYALAAG